MANPYAGAARAFLGQGMGMGWGDEAEAWLRSKLGGEQYEPGLKRIRDEYAQYSKENPFTSGALEFGGGAAPAVGAMLIPGGQAAGAAQLQRSTMSTLARLGGLGAATGAVSGAGSATEGGRVGGAGQGAVLGGALGVALPVGMRGVSGASRWLVDRLAPTEARIADRAAGKLNAALRESGLTPQDIATRMAQDRALRVPSVVANTSNATADLAQAVAQRTGSGARKIEDALTQQKLGSKERTYSQVKRSMQPGDYYADEQRLVEELRAKAPRIYDSAYAHGSVDDPVINSVLKDPAFAAAFTEAKGIARKQELAAKLRGEDPTPYQLQDIYTLGTDAAGNTIVQGVKVPDVRTLDYVKRGLDSMIDAGFRGQGMTTAQAAALKDLRKTFVNRIDDLVPEYKAARAGYAGDMEVIDAMRAGMNDFGKMDHEQIVKLVSGMSQAEKEAYRTGVARNLYSKVMGPSGNFNAAQRIIGSPETQAKLQPLFETPAHYELFKNALTRESQLFTQADKVLGGSQTAKRTQMRENLEDDGDVGQAIGQAITGGFWQSLMGLTARTLGKTLITEKTADKMAKMLMSKDPSEVAAVVQALERQAAGAAPKAVRSTAAERGAVMGTASAVWPSPSQSPEQAPGASLMQDLEAEEQQQPPGMSQLMRDLAAEEAKTR